MCGHETSIFDPTKTTSKIFGSSSFWNNNYIAYESNGDKNKSLSLKEYLDKIKSYLRDIVIDLQEYDT